MELKTRDGFKVISEEEVKTLHEVAQFIPVIRNSVSKSWRMMDKFLKLLEKLEKKEKTGGKDEKASK